MFIKQGQKIIGMMILGGLIIFMAGCWGEKVNVGEVAEILRTENNELQEKILAFRTGNKKY